MRGPDIASLVAGDRTVWFDSKVDRWLAVALVTVPVATVASTLLTIVAGESWLPGLLACLLIAVLYFGLVLPVRYGISPDELVVRHGLICHRIRIAAIAQVQTTRSPLSSPALSLDRLRIDYGPGWFQAVMVSPKDRQGFLALLSLRAGRSFEA
jgi:membrane protein YdbS with pleckstrin-like domain